MTSIPSLDRHCDLALGIVPLDCKVVVTGLVSGESLIELKTSDACRWVRVDGLPVTDSGQTIEVAGPIPGASVNHLQAVKVELEGYVADGRTAARDQFIVPCGLPRAWVIVPDMLKIDLVVAHCNSESWLHCHGRVKYTY